MMFISIKSGIEHLKPNINVLKKLYK